MPVVECACGMVMSVATREPRSRCIRCGGIELRFMEKLRRSQLASRQFDRDSAQPRHAHPMVDLASLGIAAIEQIADGACI